MNLHAMKENFREEVATKAEEEKEKEKDEAVQAEELTISPYDNTNANRTLTLNIPTAILTFFERSRQNSHFKR